MDTRARILVVADEPGLRETCRLALAPGGFAVEAARDSREAWEKVRASEPRGCDAGVPAAAAFDLILLDVALRGVLSFDLLNRIRATDPDAVCILLTDPAAVPFATNLVRQGAYDYLVTPFSPDAVLLAVERGLERRSLLMEARRLRSVEADVQRLALEKARLEELDRAKAAFIRLVTHELQSPAAAVLSYLQLILDGYIPAEKQRETIEKAAARANEQIALIGDLLELGRLQAVRDRGRVTPVSLGGVLEEALEALRSQADQKGLRLVVNIAPDVPPVLGVAAEFKSLWTNLVGNAVKYTPPGGEVVVSLRTDRRQAVGQVRDTGIGISADARDRLFTEFYRAENAKALSLRGTGLGLAIVKRIVEDADGQIWVESQLGRGSTFTFVLPAAAGEMAGPGEPKSRGRAEMPGRTEPEDPSRQPGVSVAAVTKQARAGLWVIPKTSMPLLLAHWAGQYEVIAPCEVSEGHVEFGPYTDAGDLRLDYATTVVPPKKVWLPQREVLFAFRQGAAGDLEDQLAVEPVLDGDPRVVVGLHTCDLHALRTLDAAFAEGQGDAHYLERRSATRVVSVECLTACDEHAFCKSMNTLSAAGGFDLHLVDLGDAYSVQVGTPAGAVLLTGSAGVACGVRPASEEDVTVLNRVLSDKWPRFPHGLDFDAQELPSLMAQSYGSPVWQELDERCLACGACTLVCPTCYCFNVLDDLALPSAPVEDVPPDGAERAVRGERVRVWDSCQLDEFACVSTGENFRETRARRQRHRFLRKGKYIPDALGESGCVGCGRCARACLVHISPVEVWNALNAERARGRSRGR